MVFEEASGLFVSINRKLSKMDRKMCLCVTLRELRPPLNWFLELPQLFANMQLYITIMCTQQTRVLFTYGLTCWLSKGDQGSPSQMDLPFLYSQLYVYSDAIVYYNLCNDWQY